MDRLTLIARVTAKPEHIDWMKAALEKLIVPTRAERGCVQYDLHQDNENPAHFMLIEQWQTRDLWQVHMENAHLKTFMEQASDKLADLTCYEMSHIA